MTVPFWKEKSLSDMTPEEWESLCDGCGKCCIHKLEDEETGDIYETNVVCRFLDDSTCQCTQYEKRSILVPDCVTLTPVNLQDVYFMPPTCAYRLLAEGKELYDWHPLVSGGHNKMHEEGHSVKGKVISEVDADDLMQHLTKRLDD